MAVLRNRTTMSALIVPSSHFCCMLLKFDPPPDTNTAKRLRRTAAVCCGEGALACTSRCMPLAFTPADRCALESGPPFVSSVAALETGRCAATRLAPTLQGRRTAARMLYSRELIAQQRPQAGPAQ